MVKNDIRELVRHALVAAQADGSLPQAELEILLDHPPKPRGDKPALGDYATNAAMMLSKAARGNPMQYAQILATHLPAAPFVEQPARVAAPGFINFTLTPAFLQQEVERILQAGDHYGDLNVGLGQRVQIEFVSANPTGLVHIGNGRGAFIGDVLGNVLRVAGYITEKEYYVNDFGNQVVKLGHSLVHYYLQELDSSAEIQRSEDVVLRDPKDPKSQEKTRITYRGRRRQTGGQWSEWEEFPYGGEYYADVARQIIAQDGSAYRDLADEERIEALGQAGARLILTDIKKTMDTLGIHFDVWFTESSLHESGEAREAIEVLRKNGYIEERDGALWLKSSEFGDDKDRVVVGSKGRTTYIASDIAYTRNKFERGFERLIYILGPDHHGYVARLKASAQALGYNPEAITVLIYQQVNLVRGGKAEKIGKRLGNAISLDELIGEVGPDVARFFYLTRGTESHLDFDIELATKESDENPVYYVQYGHARIASILRKAAERGLSDFVGGNVSLLTHPAELELIKRMLMLEEVIERAATQLEPHHLTHYSIELAATFHSFYNQCRVLSADPADLPLTKARLKLVSAAKLVLARSLAIMGMSAPERMARVEEEV